MADQTASSNSTAFQGESQRVRISDWIADAKTASTITTITAPNAIAAVYILSPDSRAESGAGLNPTEHQLTRAGRPESCEQHSGGRVNWGSWVT